MHADKALSGIKAVQTLSRLNRAHPPSSDARGPRRMVLPRIDRVENAVARLCVTSYKKAERRRTLRRIDEHPAGLAAPLAQAAMWRIGARHGVIRGPGDTWPGGAPARPDRHRPKRGRSPASRRNRASRGSRLMSKSKLEIPGPLGTSRRRRWLSGLRRRAYSGPIRGPGDPSAEISGTVYLIISNRPTSKREEIVLR